MSEWLEGLAVKSFSFVQILYTWQVLFLHTIEYNNIFILMNVIIYSTHKEANT